MNEFHSEPMIYDRLNIQDNKYEYKVNIIKFRSNLQNDLIHNKMKIIKILIKIKQNPMYKVNI